MPKRSRTKSEASPLVRFGRRIRDLRFHQSLSQEQLAAKAHRHWSYVAQVERGERNITLVTICDLAEALGVGPDVLLAKGLPDGVVKAPADAKVRAGGRRGPRRSSRWM